MAATSQSLVSAFAFCVFKFHFSSNLLLWYLTKVSIHSGLEILQKGSPPQTV